MEKKPASSFTAFLSLMLTVFIDLLGIGIIIPVLAVLFFEQNGLFYHVAGPAVKNLIYGVLIAAYPLGQFFASPILGDLSDRHGRKKLLTISIFGTLFGYALSAVAIIFGRLDLLFLGRLIDGLTGGNLAIAYSAISDLSTPKTKPKNFGLIGMAFGLGFIIGPYLGGVLSDPRVVSWFTFATPFWFAAGLALINAIFVITSLPETLKHPRAAVWSLFSGIKNIRKAFGLKNIRLLLLVVFLLTFGFSFFAQFFQVYLIAKFHYDQRQIGQVFGFIGLCVVIVQALVVRPLAHRYPAKSILFFSIPLLGLMFPLLLIPDQSHYIFFILPFIALFQGTTQPNITAVVSDNASKKMQGEMLGINQSMQSLAQALPPLIAAVIISLNVRLPLLVAGGTTIIAWLCYLVFMRSHVQEKVQEEE